ncbi:MAG: hypothetical protein PPFGHCPK_00044 [Spiroplasma endosymbiont of Drosophila atripex]|nr:MAG: hypothetical protein PPFGHCPK_00044 [Spiroplasma endosymbiont of Drosophila atripex]
MLKFSKTLSNIGIYLLLTTLMPVKVISIIMISLKGLMESSYELLWKFGEWLQEVFDSGLSTIQWLGWIILIACLTTYGILIFILVMINSRKAFEQRIGYILGLVIGVGSIVVTLLPLIIVSIASLGNGVITLVLGLSFVFIGLNGGLVACGSLFGLISAKNIINLWDAKKK